MARNNEPAFRRKTPLLTCSIRTEIPYPCIGSRANVFRMSISSVPWTRSLGLSAIKVFPPGKQEENTPLILFVKGSATTVLTLRDNNKGDGRCSQGERLLYVREPNACAPARASGRRGYTGNHRPPKAFFPWMTNS